MNNKTNDFTANDLFSNAVLVVTDNEGKEVTRFAFLVVIVFGLFSGLIPLGVLLLLVMKWKIALVNKESAME